MSVNDYSICLGNYVMSNVPYNVVASTDFNNNGVQAWYKNGNHAMAVWVGTPVAAWNGAQSVLYVGRENSTFRSINCAGNVATSGNDYAEYITKSSSNITFSKGDIVGVDSTYKLTDKWSESRHFLLKSTEPSFVGGDTWFTEPRPDDSNLVADWEARMEAARWMVDRVAFSGVVPVNITGCTVGEYIVPIEGQSNAIGMSNMSEEGISFTDYKKAVGKVVKVLDDGRAYVVVKAV
jgi:hypothetical protein